MSFKDKISNFFGLTDEEEYYEEEVSAYQQGNFESRAEEQQKQYIVQQPKVASQGYFQQAQGAAVSQQPQTAKIRANGSEAAYESVNRSRSVAKEEKVVPITAPPQSRKTTKAKEIVKSTGKITIVEPRVYSEAMGIAKQVLHGDAVLVNFHLIEEHQARRIVDFLTGTVYAEDGDIKRVGDEIFLCTPKGLEIEGTAQTLVDSNIFDL